MNIRRLQILSWCLLFSYLLGAQQLAHLNIPFQHNNQNLKNPLVGGLNNPQFSEVDLNNDGILDLFVFDRSGNAIITYLNGGNANQIDYTYAPEYIQQFPKLSNWALLRDYDQDGVMDLFAASTVPGIPGVEVYRGAYQNGKITFERLQFYGIGFNVLSFEDASGDLSNLYVSAQDVPAIDDIDDDGDIDIFSFGVNGGYIFHYENQSQEMGYGSDSLLFSLKTTCLGGIYESGITVCICLPEAPGACCDGLNSGAADTRHAGSTLLTFDDDGDGDKELLLGDLSFANMVMLYNTMNDNSIFYGSQDCSYPSNDVPVDLDIFPASFYVDLNNDGKKDLLASPNAPSNTENYFCVWHYNNQGSANNPDFQFQRKDLFVNEMVDYGSGSNPTFVDYNQDGLMDLVIGSETFYLPSGGRDARLVLYENVGTAAQPSFKLIDDDYLNFSQYESTFYALAPAFGDMDNDSDLDLIVGGHSGELFYLENTAGAGNTFSFSNLQPIYFDIDVGQFSTPQIVDLNRDGLPDLVIGELNGNLNYLPNIGTPTEPAFESDHEIAPNIPFLGKVDVREFGLPWGYSDPLFVDFNGEYMLFCGSELGQIWRYTDIDDNLEDAFTLEEEQYGDNVRVGTRIRPALADLNNDNILDMMTGNRRGGLNGFQTNFTISGSVSTQYVNTSSSFELFPNPVRDQLSVVLDQVQNVSFEISIYNAIGQLLQERQSQERTTIINTQHLAAGLYLCQLRVGEQVTVQKFVVQ